MRYRFPGFHDFLRVAAERIGHPEAEVPARRIATLASLANLCAQAGSADADDVASILAKADEFRDQIEAAFVAAEMMLAEARALEPREEEPGGVGDEKRTRGAKVKRRRDD